MNQNRDKLKLSAILSADVVGYSRLMEKDRDWTIKNLEENKDLISNLVEEYKGRVVDAPGDNILAEFSSITNAVECAVKIQKELKKKNSKLMEDHRMEFRIGINLGEVFEEDGRIYGSGVNIAARIEGLSKSGGICISGRTYDHVKTEFDFGYEYLGEHEVKNISEPIRVYRLLVTSETAGKVLREKRFLGRLPRRIKTVNFIIWIAFTAVVSFIIAGIATWNLKQYEPFQVIRFDYKIPKGQQFSHSTNPIFAVSSNGDQLAYSTSKGIYLRSMNEVDAKLIAGTAEKTMSPFFSPDGKWIAYWSLDDLQLKKISILGGTPRPLCSDLSIAYYDWGIDGNIYYAGTKGIMRVSDTGGDPETLIELREEEEAFFSPQLLPDGKSVMFTIDTGGEYKIAVQSIDSDDREILLDGHTARYLPTGHLIYMTGNDIKAVPFDIGNLAATGGVVTIVEDIVWFGPPQFSISNSGTFAYLENISTPRSLVWVDLMGKEEELNTPPAIYLTPKISPDATRIALSISDSTGKQDIGIWNIDREGTTLIPNKESTINYYPIWTPDSKFIIFAQMLGSNIGIYRMSSDGTGKIDPLYTEKKRQIMPTSLSRDGAFLLCQIQITGIDIQDIGILTNEENPEWRLLLQEDYIESQAQISPDGKWMAYASNETGQTEVYVRSFPEVDKVREQISTEGGESPLWSPDGTQLYYRNGDLVMAAAVETKAEFEFEKPKILFQRLYYTDPDGAISWDIHLDGKRFLMMKEIATESSEGTSRPRIHMVINWFEELKQMVPVD